MLTMLLFAALLGNSQAAQEAPARAMRVKVVNAAARRIRAVYVSPSSQPGWGANLLEPAQAARPGRKGAVAGLRAAARAEVAVTGPCGLYDVRIVGEKGAEFLLDEVELCEDGDVLTLTEGQLTHVKARDVSGERQ